MLTWIRGTFRNIFLTMVTNEPRILTVTLVAVTNTNSHILYLPLMSTYKPDYSVILIGSINNSPKTLKVSGLLLQCYLS